MNKFNVNGFTLILMCLSCVSCVSCGECPLGTYLRGRSCERCLPECRSGQIKIERCNQTSRFMCQCPSNKYWDGNLAVCKLCSKCGLEEIILKNCSHNHNRECVKCPKGTFVKTAFTCHKCAHCEEGEIVRRKCQGQNDTLCFRPDYEATFIRITNKPVLTPTQPVQNHLEADSTAVTALAIVVALGFVSFILVCLCWRCSTVVQRRNKCPESSFTDDSEIDDLVKKRPLPPVRDNGLMVRNLNPQIIEELCLLLNPEGFRNWKMLAGKLNFSQCKIQNFKMYQEPCQEVFKEWETEGESTVFVLYNHLLAMKRDDCTELLHKYLIEDNQV